MPTLLVASPPQLKRWPKKGEIVIVDLEYTAWRNSNKFNWGRPWEWREIIQIGAVLVSSNNFKILKTFNVYVRPEKNKDLSSYIKKLTGISQNTIDSQGIGFLSAFKRLKKFIPERNIILANGSDGQILNENLILHRASKKPFLPICVYNFKPLLSKKLSIPEMNLISSKLPKIAGIRKKLRAHSALDDCFSICSALCKWRENRLI
jgi:inhibitor of KinA sporulation pathway (predicted exonuclease)